MPLDLFAIPTLLNYDTAIDWSARLGREAPLLRRELDRAPSRRVLDLGSATGEHMRWLVADGFTAVGIEGVKERWEAAKALAGPNEQHLIGDLGAVEAMVRGHFGAALCLGNTLPALIGVEAMSRMLIGLRRRLLPGGVLVAQQVNWDSLHARAKLGIGDGMALPERRLAGDHGELLFRRALTLRDDGVVGIAESTILVENGDAPEGRRLHQRHFFQQGWRAEELRTLLDVAGFRRVELFGGFADEAFDAERSPELVIVAR